jgi:hypothetical protein
MIILMQTTIDYIAKTNPQYLEKLEGLGRPEQKQLNKIQYYKFGEYE